EIRRELAFLDRILTQARAHHALLDHGELGRQRAGAQKNGEIVGGFHGEITRDLAAAAQDRLADDGSGDHLAVAHDGKRPADVLLGDLREFARARGVELERDDRLAGALVEAGLRVGELFARHDDALVEKIGLRALRFRTVDDFGFGRRTTLQGLFHRHRCVHQAEGELRGRADDLDELFRVSKSWNLNQHAIVALPLDRGLDQTHRIHAPPDNLDRLVYHLAGTLEQRGLRGGEPDHPAADVLDVERARAGAADEAAERLRQLPELGQPLLQIVLPNDHLDRISADDGSTGETDAGLAQDAADIVLQRQQLLPAHIVGVDLEQD